MNISTPPKDTGGGLHGLGAGTESPTPNGNTRQQVERDKKALIRAWEQSERDINAVLIAASAHTLSAIWFIISNIQDLRKARYYRGLYAAVLELMSQTQKTSSAAIPQDLAPPTLGQPHFGSGSELSSLQVLDINVYWIVTLAFTISTVFVAILSRQRSRDLKLGLIRQQFDDHTSKSVGIGYAQWFDMSQVIDMACRLYQVALVLFLLGTIDIFVVPINVTWLALILACAPFYIFRVFGQT